MIKLITYLSPILIVSGIAKSYFYYNAFNIRILDYLELGETLAIIAEASIFILIIIPFTWFIYFMVDVKNEHLTEPEKNLDLIDIAHQKEKFITRIRIYLQRYWALTTISILLFIFILRAWFIGLEINWIMEVLLLTFVTTTFYIIVLLEFRYKFKVVFEKELDHITAIIIHYVGIFLIMMTFFVYIETNGTKKGSIKVKDYSLFLSNGEIIKTTKDLIVIGQTSNYFFLFDRINKESTIIKKDIISKIVVK